MPGLQTIKPGRAHFTKDFPGRYGVHYKLKSSVTNPTTARLEHNRLQASMSSSNGWNLYSMNDLWCFDLSLESNGRGEGEGESP
jgi:hypothetical protein